MKYRLEIFSCWRRAVFLFSGDVGDTCFDKKKGSRVYPGQPGSGSTRFRRANSPAGFYLDPDRSQARVVRVPGRPTRPIRVSKLWYILFITLDMKNSLDILLLLTLLAQSSNIVFVGSLLVFVKRNDKINCFSIDILLLLTLLAQSSNIWLLHK